MSWLDDFYRIARRDNGRCPICRSPAICDSATTQQGRTVYRISCDNTMCQTRTKWHTSIPGAWTEWKQLGKSIR